MSRDLAESAALVSASAVMFDQDGRLLVVKARGEREWDIPGGHLAVGEDPVAACEREILEELGVAARVERLLAIDWAPLPDGRAKLLFVFSAELLEPVRASPRAQAELESAEYIAPNSALPMLAERVRKRVAAALDVLRGDGYAFLTDGSIPRYASRTIR
ncbi:NUDIX hydrolase [Asanoa ishikariensis]|uniref:ADP-ribose pyrophosphatase YjhB, NUDIX family n=1 Tax=Asanoa ishikariensis TaxID=137265 RepID=A0A1H3LLG7_9ACTN|nr:NUDIX hydrolase [Asanoa ishikariensis]GIF65556.1 NUDIX hydrolase [Asanoa ishikariensis]SDY65213.1 ADP-ribose pyrophosphatase YjhB, NUDIX family [Asanoa ishikariensis]